MKRILAGLALAVSAALSHAATLNPIQLLNPTGSTSGQAIVSTGASSAPAWSSIVNTVAGRSGAVTLTNSDVSGSAPLASPTFTGTVTIPPAANITAPNIIGTISGGNAAAGSVGEYVTASFSAVGMTSNTYTNLTSISLTPGDWDVVGFIGFTAANTTSVTAVIASTSLTSATLPAIGTYNQQTASWPTNGAVIGVPAPVRRVSVSSTTTVYMVGFALFSTSTLNASGFIQARRVR
jgi:hypothetical protein